MSFIKFSQPSRLMIPALVAAVTVVVALSAMSDKAQAYPEPAIVSKAWAFDFTYHKPRLIAVKDSAGQHHWYWYMTYKVVNNTDQERLFVPQITLATDAGDILAANENVPVHVFDAIKQRVANPLLDSPSRVVGKLLLGEDHAKESVAIWAVPPKDVDNVTIFVAGLSGETAVVKHPLTGDGVVMRKALMLDFDVPGTPQRIQNQDAHLRSENWIMW